MTKQSFLMTADDISEEIFGGERSARTISERDSAHPDYPKPKRNGIGGKTGKKYWKRSDIYSYYDLEVAA
jgi:hypothetical protein